MLGSMRRGRRAALAIAAVLAAGRPAAAKVTFSGYADLRFAAASLDVGGGPGVLSGLGLTAGSAQSAAFSADAIGLFATTELQDNLRFQMDLTYRSIGSNSVQTRIQYAYLDYTALPETTVKAGRIPLPFGYYNENRFYAFQRYPINSPLFQSAILGLPMVDWGAAVSRRFKAAGLDAEATVYAVNGFGSVPGSPDALRKASVPGGLSIAGNVGATDNNGKPAFGGRLRLFPVAGSQAEAGLSYYYGQWDKSATQNLQIAGLHARVPIGRLELLASALELDAQGDQGFAPQVGGADWRTRGWHATASYELGSWRGVPVVPYIQGEHYRTHAANLSAPDEKLDSLAVGTSFQLTPGARLKAEYLKFYYELPYASPSDRLTLEADVWELAVVLTF